MVTLPTHASVYYVTVAGLGGEPDYEQRFTAAAKDLDKVFKASSGAHVYTLTGSQATRVRLTETIAIVARDAKPEDDFVLTLIGHGSFDGVEYKFNLVGPDVSAAELAAMCDRVPARRQLVVNTTSASGGSVVALERSGRGIIAATKTGTEKNATVFARYWVEALDDPTATRTRANLSARWRRFNMPTERRRRSTNRRSVWRPSTQCSRIPGTAMQCGQVRRKAERELCFLV